MVLNLSEDSSLSFSVIRKRISFLWEWLEIGFDFLRWMWIFFLCIYTYFYYVYEYSSLLHSLLLSLYSVLYYFYPLSLSRCILFVYLFEPLHLLPHFFFFHFHHYFVDQHISVLCGQTLPMSLLIPFHSSFHFMLTTLSPLKDLPSSDITITALLFNCDLSQINQYLEAKQYIRFVP